MVLLEQLDRLAHHITATAGARRGAARLDAFHAVVAFEYEILSTQFFGVKVHFLENVDDRGHQSARQRECAVMLGITANLQHTLAQLGERGGQVGRGRRFPDPALAIDCKNLCAFDLCAIVLMDLHRPFSVAAKMRDVSVKWAHFGPFPWVWVIRLQCPLVCLQWHPLRYAGRPVSRRQVSSRPARMPLSGGSPCALRPAG